MPSRWVLSATKPLGPSDGCYLTYLPEASASMDQPYILTKLFLMMSTGSAVLEHPSHNHKIVIWKKVFLKKKKRKRIILTLCSEFGFKDETGNIISIFLLLSVLSFSLSIYSDSL